MRLVLIGNLEMAAYVLQELLKTHHSVVGVVVPQKPVDTQNTYSLFEYLAEKNKIPIFRTNNISTESTIQFLSDLAPDLAIVIGWSQIIPEKILNIPKKGTVGLHSSMLPRGRGGAPVNWSIIHDEPEIGITLYYLDGGVDSGDILTQGSVKIEDRDDVKTVFDKLSLIAKNIVVQAVSSIESGSVSRKKQDIREATYRPRRKPVDGLIHFEKKSREIFNWIRALTRPYPGAFTYKNKKKLSVWKAELFEVPISRGVPGEILEVMKGKGLLVKTGDGGILLTRVQEEGEPEMWADDYFVYKGLQVGEVLGRKEDFPPIVFTNILGENYDTVSYPTNVRKGEQRYVIATVENYGDSISIEISAYLNDETILQQSIVVPRFERRDLKVGFCVPSCGTHTLTVIFKRGSEIIDKRYLKIFVPKE